MFGVVYHVLPEEEWGLTTAAKGEWMNAWEDGYDTLASRWSLACLGDL